MSLCAVERTIDKINGSDNYYYYYYNLPSLRNNSGCERVHAERSRGGDDERIKMFGNLRPAAIIYAIVRDDVVQMIWAWRSA